MTRQWCLTRTSLQGLFLKWQVYWDVGLGQDSGVWQGHHYRDSFLKWQVYWDVGLHTVVSVINDKTVVFDKDITTGTILEVTGLLGRWAGTRQWCLTRTSLQGLFLKWQVYWDVGLQTVVSVINDKTVVFDKDITTGTILEVTSLLGHWAANSSQCY